ncbi:hypothetical protein D3C72_1912500 [compost metagenome]
MVGGNPVPGRISCRRLFKNVFIRLLVIIPEFPFLQIADIKLPVFGRILKPFLYLLQLLLFGNMEKQLDNQRVLFRQHLLKVANLLKAALGLGLLLIAVNAGNQNILIMGTVKSRNIAFGRRLLMDSPEEVMGRFV